jgi:hypothetical protein
MASKKPTQTTLRGLDAALWRKIESYRKKMERWAGVPISQNTAILTLVREGLLRNERSGR